MAQTNKTLNKSVENTTPVVTPNMQVHVDKNGIGFNITSGEVLLLIGVFAVCICAIIWMNSWTTQNIIKAMKEK